MYRNFFFLNPCGPSLTPAATSSCGEQCYSTGTGFTPEMLCYTEFANLSCLPSPCLPSGKGNILIILEKGLV